MMMVDEATPNRTTPTSTRATVANANESDAAQLLRPTPRTNGGGRPRTPASASAVRDGRNLLTQFRNNKRRDEPSPQAAAVPLHANGSSAPSAAKPTSGKSTAVDDVARYASRAPGIARKLEAALDASLANRRNTGETNGSVVGGEDNRGEPSDAAPEQAALRSSTLDGGPNGDTVEPSGRGIGSDHGVGSSDGAVSAATAAAAAAAPSAGATAAVAVTKPSPPKKDAISRSEGSPERLTPEV